MADDLHLPKPGVFPFQGLGTSTAAEAKDYFSRMEAHRKQFVWDSEEAGTLIDMAFAKKKVGGCVWGGADCTQWMG